MTHDVSPVSCSVMALLEPVLLLQHTSLFLLLLLLLLLLLRASYNKSAGPHAPRIHVHEE